MPTFRNPSLTALPSDLLCFLYKLEIIVNCFNPSPSALASLSPSRLIQPPVLCPIGKSANPSQSVRLVTPLTRIWATLSPLWTVALPNLSLSFPRVLPRERHNPPSANNLFLSSMKKAEDLAGAPTLLTLLILSFQSGVGPLCPHVSPQQG